MIDLEKANELFFKLKKIIDRNSWECYICYIDNWSYELETLCERLNFNYIPLIIYLEFLQEKWFIRIIWDIKNRKSFLENWIIYIDN